MPQESMEAAEVRNLRQRLGLTQKELAEFLNVMPCVVSNWETGRHRPTGTAVVMLRMLSAGDLSPVDGVARNDGAVLTELPIRRLVEALRWIDEHGPPDAGLVRSLTELVEGGEAAWRGITMPMGTDPAELEEGIVALAAVTHCRRLLEDAQAGSEGTTRGGPRRG